MKKLLVAVAFMLFFASLVYAEGNPTAVNEYNFEIKNNTGNGKLTVIPTTIIRPKVDKITAYSVMPLWTNTCENYVAVYDSATVNTAVEVLGERENVANTGDGERFSRPRKIVNGIVVIQGAYTVVHIHFISE